MMSNRINNLLLITMCVLLVSVPITQPSVSYVPHASENHRMPTLNSSSDLSGVRIALYEGYGVTVVTRVKESRTALFNMLTWMNASVEIINDTDIEQGALWAFEVLVIPEGLGPIIENDLGDIGIQAIRTWVDAGGSYVGVRGSSSIAVTDGDFEGRHETFELGLINGTSVGMPEEGYIVVTELQVNQACIGPDLSGIPDKIHTLFRTGRYFEPHPGQEIICIANYSSNNKPAMIASHFGEGNVFISSPQFEYEEDSDRDGTDYMDEYTDPDSEWPLVMQTIRWQIEDSPVVVNTTTWGEQPVNPLPLQEPMEIVLIGTMIGIVAIIAIVFVMKK